MSAAGWVGVGIWLALLVFALAAWGSNWTKEIEV